MPPKPAAPRASISSLSRLPASARQHRHCRSCRHLALRHDAGIRRCVPARKNRHARFCRSGGDQQIRSQGRRRRACATFAKQVQRNRKAFTQSPDTLPVYGAIAARFQDDGVTGLYLGLRDLLVEKGFDPPPSRFDRKGGHVPSTRPPIVPSSRQRYLAEIAAEISRLSQNRCSPGSRSLAKSSS